MDRNKLTWQATFKAWMLRFKTAWYRDARPFEQQSKAIRVYQLRSGRQ